MEEKKMDLKSMVELVETTFERFNNVDIYVGSENLCEANLTYYFGYFACARDLGLISEDREEWMTDKLTDTYNKIINDCSGNSPEGQELHKW